MLKFRFDRRITVGHAQHIRFDPGQRSLSLAPVSSANITEKRPLQQGNPIRDSQLISSLLLKVIYALLNIQQFS